MQLHVEADSYMILQCFPDTLPVFTNSTSKKAEWSITVHLVLHGLENKNNKKKSNQMKLAGPVVLKPFPKQILLSPQKFAH